MTPVLAPIASSLDNSLGDSTFTTMPAATAALSSSGRLPGPAKLMRSFRMPVEIATSSSPAEATSRPSTRSAIYLTTSGIGFAFIA
jgi:hypothetical protein